jgi:DNA-binding transcriptional LysR family regulator
MFRQMTTFVRIAEMGNITRAARSLGLSVPMASRHLRWLEKDLEVALIHRTTRQLRLTDAGREFAQRARGLIAGLDDAKAALRVEPGLEGRVVVSAPNALGAYELASVMPALALKHPRLRVELRLDDRAVDLVKDGVDVAIRAAAPPDRASLVARELATYQRVVCAAPSFLARHGAIGTLATLASTPCVVHGCGPAAWNFETPEGPKSITVDGPLCTNSVVIIREAVLAGVGVAWLPSYVVGEEIADGRLVQLLPEAKLPPIRVYGIMPKHARQTATVRAVLDFIGAALRARGRGPRASAGVLEP